MADPARRERTGQLGCRSEIFDSWEGEIDGGLLGIIAAAQRSRFQRGLERSTRSSFCAETPLPRSKLISIPTAQIAPAT